MAERDPYEILGLERGASAPQIRKAYRRLAKRYHPEVAEDTVGETKAARSEAGNEDMTMSDYGNGGES